MKNPKDLSAFAAKKLDFESSIKVRSYRDWPHFLDQDQTWSDLQLVHFLQWSEYSKYLGRSFKVQLFDFSQQEMLYKKFCRFESI